LTISTNFMVKSSLKSWFIHLVKKFPTFMENEGSSPYSQKHATGPYPQPAEFW